MNKKKYLLYIIGLIGLLLVAALIYLYVNFRGAPSAFLPPRQDISKLVKQQNSPLSIPESFNLKIFAEGLNKPRVLHVDPNNNLLVSEMGAGKIIGFKNSDPTNKVVVLAGLYNPHGIETHCKNSTCSLYVAQTDKVIKYQYNLESMKATTGKKILDLPDDGGHYTRTLLIHNDKLLISIGSKCNACVEADERRAAIISTDLDGNNFEIYASGLRNSVFLKHFPDSNTIWATDNGRDKIGDDIPPDEINIIYENNDYGWPYCYGQQINDVTVDNTFNCKRTKASHIDIQAHSAALGFDFLMEETWPEEFNNSILVAYHGSWNRTIPTGYKIMQIKLDDNMQELTRSDFVTGWLSSDGNAIGRPVDIITSDNGTILISDDHAGVIYLLELNN